jgi:hypothetical protein
VACPASDVEGTRVGELYAKRHREADRRLERALNALAAIKKLLPRTIQIAMVQQPSAVSSVPLIPGINGDHPGMAVKQQRWRDEAVATSIAEPRLNGKQMQTNGHHRLSELLDPAEVA